MRAPAFAIVAALGLVLAVGRAAEAQATAIVVDASESARRAGAEKAEAAIQGWLEQAPGEVRAFGTGDASEADRASARAAFPHEWGGSSDVLAPVGRAARWLAAVGGERTLVLVSDLELDVVGVDDAPPEYLEGLPADADRETVNLHARDLFRASAIPRLRDLGARVVLVRLPLPLEARRVSLEEDLAALPGARVIDGGGDPRAILAALVGALPARAPVEPPAAAVGGQPQPALAGAASLPPRSLPPLSPPPSVAHADAAPPVEGTRPEGGEPRGARRALGAALALGSLVLLGLLLARTAQPSLAARRLVPLAADGRLLAAEELVLERHRTARGVAELAFGAGHLGLRARRGGGVELLPRGVDASIEGVPVSAGAGLVHGMVVALETPGVTRALLYLEREPNASERRRVWLEPSAQPTKKTRSFLASGSRESISDVGSVDELIVIDDSDEPRSEE